MVVNQTPFSWGICSVYSPQIECTCSETIRIHVLSNYPRECNYRYMRTRATFVAVHIILTEYDIFTDRGRMGSRNDDVNNKELTDISEKDLNAISTQWQKFLVYDGGYLRHHRWKPPFLNNPIKYHAQQNCTKIASEYSLYIPYVWSVRVLSFHRFMIVSHLKWSVGLVGYRCSFK